MSKIGIPSWCCWWPVTHGSSHNLAPFEAHNIKKSQQDIADTTSKPDTSSAVGSNSQGHVCWRVGRLGWFPWCHFAFPAGGRDFLGTWAAMGALCEARLVSRLLGLQSQEDWYTFVEADAVRALAELLGIYLPPRCASGFNCFKDTAMQDNFKTSYEAFVVCGFQHCHPSTMLLNGKTMRRQLDGRMDG